MTPPRPHPGDRVKIVQKKDYATGILTEGVVKDVLTKKEVHPRGHKVRLTNGIIGRVQQFTNEKEKVEGKKPSKVEPIDEHDLV